MDPARDIFRAIIEDDTNFHRAHYNLGVVLAAQGDLQQALASFERAAALAPGDAPIRYNLGIVRRQLGGSQDQEIADYRLALALDPDLAEAHLSLGCVLADPQTRRDLRDEAAAREHLQRFLALALPTDREGVAEARSWLAWLADRR
jgi:tetratricopeptide (TPR) repeat protein